MEDCAKTMQHHFVLIHGVCKNCKFRTPLPDTPRAAFVTFFLGFLCFLQGNYINKKEVLSKILDENNSTITSFLMSH
jgi:hypothetical protein